MEKPQIPENEPSRTNQLEELGVVYSPAEARFDRLTRLAQRHFGVSSALVSLVYKDMQWFKSARGLNACSTSREVSFCGHVVHTGKMLVVENALADERFQDNPLVIEEPKIRFYAGVPIRGPKGEILGTFCIIDSSPKTLSGLDIHDLKDFAALAEIEFSRNLHSPVVQKLIAELTENQRSLMIDPVVGSWNRMGISKVLGKELDAAILYGQSIGMFYVKIADFDGILQRFGKLRVVDFCKFVAGNLRHCARPFDSLGNIGQDSFLIVCPGATLEFLAKLEEDIKDLFLSDPLQTLGIIAMVDVVTRYELINCEGLSEEAREKVVQLISEI